MHKILVIDDDPASVALLTQLLTRNGYVVVAAASGEEGIKVASQDAPDLILCDVFMPNGNGYFVLEECKKRAALRNIPIIAVTGHGMIDTKTQALAAGFSAYILKPISNAILLMVISEYLNR